MYKGVYNMAYKKESIDKMISIAKRYGKMLSNKAA